MRSSQSFSDLLRVLEGSPLWDCSLLQFRAQFVTFEQFGNDVRSALIDAHIVDRQHVRMIQPTGSARFLLKTAQPVRIARVGRWKNFDGNLAVQPHI